MADTRYPCTDCGRPTAELERGVPYCDDCKDLDRTMQIIGELRDKNPAVFVKCDKCGTVVRK